MKLDIQSALDLLKERGFKYTGKREQMIQILAEGKGYMSAKDVLSHMKDEFPNLSFDTIYRNLSLFEEIGILESTEFKGEKLFQFRCSETHHHHHHLICLACGKTKSIEICPMNAFFGSPDDFSITGHKFEIYGYCKPCEQQNAAQ